MRQVHFCLFWEAARKHAITQDPRSETQHLRQTHPIVIEAHSHKLV
jgi:hypothetical protein